VKIETFIRNARKAGHSVQVDRKKRCASVTHKYSDNYRLDVFVHFDENRDITHSYKYTVLRDDSSVPPILPDLSWQKFNQSA